MHKFFYLINAQGLYVGGDYKYGKYSLVPIKARAICWRSSEEAAAAMVAYSQYFTNLRVVEGI